MQSEVPTSKKCRSCRETLSIENFYRKGERRDSQCKTCILAKKKKKSRKRKNQIYVFLNGTPNLYKFVYETGELINIVKG